MKTEYPDILYLGYCCQQLIPGLHSRRTFLGGFVLHSESPCFLLARMKCQCAGETERSFQSASMATGHEREGGKQGGGGW